MAVYLNTYEVQSLYGGPEEGGWWYESGSPVQSVLLSTQDCDEWVDNQSVEYLQDLREGATLAFTQGKPPAPVKNETGGYIFALGSEEPVAFLQDNNFVSVFEGEFAQPYPAERPHYE